MNLDLKGDTETNDFNEKWILILKKLLKRRNRKTQKCLTDMYLATVDFLTIEESLRIMIYNQTVVRIQHVAIQHCIFVGTKNFNGLHL